MFQVQRFELLVAKLSDVKYKEVSVVDKSYHTKEQDDLPKAQIKRIKLRRQYSPKHGFCGTRTKRRDSIETFMRLLNDGPDENFQAEIQNLDKKGSLGSVDNKNALLGTEYPEDSNILVPNQIASRVGESSQEELDSDSKYGGHCVQEQIKHIINTLDDKYNIPKVPFPGDIMRDVAGKRPRFAKSQQTINKEGTSFKPKFKNHRRSEMNIIKPENEKEQARLEKTIEDVAFKILQKQVIKRKQSLLSKKISEEKEKEKLAAETTPSRLVDNDELTNPTTLKESSELTTEESSIDKTQSFSDLAKKKTEEIRRNVLKKVNEMEKEESMLNNQKFTLTHRKKERQIRPILVEEENELLQRKVIDYSTEPRVILKSVKHYPDNSTTPNSYVDYIKRKAQGPEGKIGPEQKQGGNEDYSKSPPLKFKRTIEPPPEPGEKIKPINVAKIMNVSDGTENTLKKSVLKKLADIRTDLLGNQPKETKKMSFSFPRSGSDRVYLKQAGDKEREEKGDADNIESGSKKGKNHSNLYRRIN